MPFSGLFGSNESPEPSEADNIRSGIILSDLERYENEGSYLEEMYANRLMGPQAEQDRSAGLQTVANSTDNAFQRAYARNQERRRKHGLGNVSQGDQRRLQISQQVAKAKNTTDYGRFHDRMREGLL